MTGRARRREIELLGLLSDAMAAPWLAGSPTDVAAGMLAASLAVLDADAGFVGRLLGPDALQVVHVSGYAYEKTERLVLQLDAPYPLAEAVRSDRALFIGSNEELRCDYPGLIRMSHRDHACATLPLATSGRSLGALNVSYDEPRSFGPRDRELLQLLAYQFALVIERAEHEALQRAVGSLARAVA